MRRIIGRILPITALAVAALIVFIVIVPRVNNALGGSAGIHDAAALPEHLSICGRDWHKDSLERELSLAALRARDGIGPVLLDPGPFPPCPDGTCRRVAQDGPCHTVVYVRVGAAAYLDYSLQGGP